MEPLWSMWDGHLGCINTTEHRIDLEPNARCVHKATYRVGPAARQFEKSEIGWTNAGHGRDRARKHGVGIPIVFAPKNDRSLRFCVDYKRLDEVTIKDLYPFPCMDQCLVSLTS